MKNLSEYLTTYCNEMIDANEEIKIKYIAHDMSYEHVQSRIDVFESVKRVINAYNLVESINKDNL